MEATIRRLFAYNSPMSRPLMALLVAAIACHGGAAPAPQSPPPRVSEPAAHALSGLAAQHIIVLPTYVVRVAPELNWGTAIGRPVDVQRTMDADIVAALDERGVRKAWIFPEQLEQSYRRNASYGSDPYALAEEPLRRPGLGSDTRLPEPLASQLRTLVALHDDTRLILAPVELRFEKVGAGGRGILRLVLIDPRYSNVRWTGEVASDPVPSFGPAITASIAAKLAGVIATP
jgi:hypothetical protein